MVKYLLFILALGFFLPQVSQAEEVTLLIWVEDRGAFNSENYELAMKSFREQGARNIRTIYVEETEMIYGSMFEKTKKTLKHDDKITNLILASHGTTRKAKNITSLTNLGGFGAEGPIDELKYILSWLSPYFSSKLHIYLESCKTMCGTEQEVSARVNGLYQELQKFGVKDFSIWGATKSLRSHIGKYKNQYEKIKLGAKEILPIAAVGNVAVSVLAYLYFSQGSLDMDALKTTLEYAKVTAIVSALQSAGLYFYLFKGIGNNGLLWNVDENGINVMKSKRLDSVSMKGVSTCSSLFR